MPLENKNFLIGKNSCRFEGDSQGPLDCQLKYQLLARHGKIKTELLKRCTNRLQLIIVGVVAKTFSLSLLRISDLCVKNDRFKLQMYLVISINRGCF